MTQSVDVIIPVYNRPPDIVEYVVNDFLEQDIDRVVIANTGEHETGLADNKRVVEVHAPLPAFYPGFTRNMGATVSKAIVQVHTGADIITLSGDWGEFRAVIDGECVSPKCRILDPAETNRAMRGERKFDMTVRYLKNTSSIAMTKHTAVYMLRGPFDWAMRGWGAVDPDLKLRSKMQGLGMRWIEIATAHLSHKGGCEKIFSEGKYPRGDANFHRNQQLMQVKKTTKGWWS